MPPDASSNHGEQNPNTVSGAFRDLQSVFDESLVHDSNPWAGINLAQNTSFQAMKPSHIPGPDGVEGTYKLSTYSNKVIEAICTQSVGELFSAMKAQGFRTSGMLSEWDAPGVLVKDGRTKTPSVQEQIMGDICESQHIKQSKEVVLDDQNRAKKLYNGYLLTPLDNDVPLAYVLYNASQLPIEKRNENNDAYVAGLVETYKKIDLPKSLDRDSLIKSAPLTVDFDTIDSRQEYQGHKVKGASDLIWLNRVEKWLEDGFEYVLLWANHNIRRVPPGKKNSPSTRLSHPQGQNVESGDFFTRRGMRQIGIAEAETYAIRNNERILRECMYFRGKLKEVRDACLAIRQKHR